MRPNRLLARIHLSPHNVRFGDFERLAFALGFRRVDGEGSHRTYAHTVHPRARLNLQPVGGEAKPYQVKQLLKLVEEYNLRLEGEDDDP